MIKSSKKILALVSTLLLVAAPMLHIGQCDASQLMRERPVSSCCCCAADGVESPMAMANKPDCSCEVTESPLDMELPPASIQSHDSRDFAPKAMPLVKYEPVKTESPFPSQYTLTNDPGKSPPAYILSCALLI